MKLFLIYFCVYGFCSMGDAQSAIKTYVEANPILLINRYALAAVEVTLQNAATYVTSSKDRLEIHISATSHVSPENSCRNIQKYCDYIKENNITPTMAFLEFFDLVVSFKEHDTVVLTQDVSLRTKIEVGNTETVHSFVIPVHLPWSLDLKALSVDIQWRAPPDVT